MSPDLPEIRWIDLPGVVNMRDIGGKTTADGALTRHGVLIRTDNLQDLPPESVRRLVDEFGVTDVVDLRTNAERAGTGHGPLKAEPLTFHELTLYQEDADEHGIPDDDDPEPNQLPWQDESTVLQRQNTSHDVHLANHYFGYLNTRPDHVLAAVRAIAHAPGAVLVHCAAGKDRTGTIVALTLTELGVDREAIVADYDATNQRLELIFNRLANTDTYREDMAGQVVADQSTPAATMRMLLLALDEEYGTDGQTGVQNWLRHQGWTEDDAAALRAKLIEENA